MASTTSPSIRLVWLRTSPTTTCSSMARLYCRTHLTSTTQSGWPTQRWSVYLSRICSTLPRSPSGAMSWASNWKACLTPIYAMAVRIFASTAKCTPTRWLTRKATSRVMTSLTIILTIFVQVTLWLVCIRNGQSPRICWQWRPWWSNCRTSHAPLPIRSSGTKPSTPIKYGSTASLWDYPIVVWQLPSQKK